MTKINHPPRLLSSSSLTGTSVKNMNREDIGTVKDLMIHLSSGKVAYAVLSFGGFMGMGRKLFAVPFSAFKLDTGHEEFLLDVSKETLERSGGFDEDDWPDFGDVSFHDRAHSAYGLRPSWD